jgi:hypothetical protein
VHNRHLEIHAPGEFEDYYDEYERIVESEMDEEERRKARVELGERYGVVWHEELIPEVRARFRARAVALIHPSAWNGDSRKLRQSS